MEKFELEHMTRREAIGLAIAAGGACLIAAVPSYPGNSVVEAAILSILGHADGAKRIGRAALAALPDLNDRDALLTGILEDLGIARSDAVFHSIDDTRIRLSERIRADFVSGRTAKVDGWVLSLAELRLCALAVLHDA